MIQFYFVDKVVNFIYLMSVAKTSIILKNNNRAINLSLHVVGIMNHGHIVDAHL